MRAVSALLARPRLVAGLLAGASAAMLAGAFWFQHVEGLAPCPLCIAQRWAHAASLALGLVAFALAPRRAPLLLALAGLAFLAGAGIAAYHVAVEWHWIESAFCGAPESAADTIDSLRAELWETEVAACDKVAWSLAGISMAGYNLLVSLGLAAVALAGAAAARGRERTTP